jgi:lipopolysaccharide export system protein LptA
MTARTLRSLLAALALGLMGPATLAQAVAADAVEPAANAVGPEANAVEPAAGGVGPEAKASPSSAVPFVGARTDTSLPIEITADTLEVKQNQQLAIFRGKVDALQGEMRLRADELIVHYRDNKENPDQPGISKIEAEGNVFVSSPKETGKGARGVYDVDHARIDLVGDVVLTQGQNIVKGDTLEMNLTTGESKVASGKTGGGRVRSLFVPEKKPVAGKNDPSSQQKN